jgi:hypothetical protein
MRKYTIPREREREEGLGFWRPKSQTSTPPHPTPASKKICGGAAPNLLSRQRRWRPAARRSSRSSTVSYLPTPKRPAMTSSFLILSFSLMFFSCFCRGHIRHHQRWPQHCGQQASPQLPPVSCFHTMWCLQMV